MLKDLKKIFVLAMLMAVVFCKRVKSQTDALEVAITHCLDSTYTGYGFDLFAELDAFEALLVKEGQLEGLPVDYHALFKLLKKDNSHAFFRNYEAKTPLDSLFKPEFGHCFKKFRHSALFEQSDSFYKRLSLALEQSRLRGYDNAHSFFIDNLWKTLRSEDYKNALFRYYAIYTIYIGALNNQHLDR